MESATNPYKAKTDMAAAAPRHAAGFSAVGSVVCRRHFGPPQSFLYKKTYFFLKKFA